MPTRRPSAPSVLAILALAPLLLPVSGSAAPVGLPGGIEALMDAFRWRNIGPANMGGRIVDIEAVESDFRRVYLATASGGVWRSENAGTSWTPIFDDQPVVSVGDIAIYQPDPDILWVGSGEANNRNSVSWGNGVYRSTDGGETFTHMGLEETHQIARVIIHPADPDVVYVAAIGHLWGTSGERGLFKTVDGGASWARLGGGLPDDGRTGATDLVMDPTDPETLYVAFYERLRRPWTFHSGGPNGGIFKSTDGGATWRRLEAGLPTGDTGRIGLAIYRSDPRVLMALVEAQRSEDLAEPGSGLYRSGDGGASWEYVNTYNNRPFYYSQVRINPLDDQRVYLLTTRFMVSDDGGRTLRNGAEDEEIHGDFHAMWLDPNDADRYYIGQDKGAFLTHDHGEHFLMFDNLALGQYYRIGVDMRDPYYVYGGLQDNGTWAGPSFSRDVRGILNDSNWKLHWGDGMHIQIDPNDWRRVYTEAENGSFRRYDPVTHRSRGARPTPASVANLGDYVALDRASDRPPFRFNWTAPLVMSPHDPRTLFLAGNHVFRTRDGGDSWEIISPDLTTDDPARRDPSDSGGLTLDNSGAEQHCTITTLAPSPIDPQLIWAGSDDGLVHVTRDGGRTWRAVQENVSGVPEGTWVSRIEASRFDPERAYLTYDPHRSDRFDPLVFVTDDGGASWRPIATGIPDGHTVHVIREDRRNPDLLFVGTEFGLFISIDRGASWHPFMNGMPTVAINDLVIHPRDNDLIAGTHGRSIWILDDITPLQQLGALTRHPPAHLFAQRRATLWENVSRGGQRGHQWFAGDNPATIEPTSSLARARFRNGALISYWLGDVPEGDEVMLEIRATDGDLRRSVRLPATAGLHRYRWDLRFDPRPLTTQQRARLEAMFQEAMARDGAVSRFVAPAHERFAAARTDLERLDAAAILAFGGRRLPADLRVPEAGAGSYLLTLQVGDRRSTSTLEIRPDPLLGTAGSE